MKADRGELRSRSSGARILAPIALLAAAIAVITIASGSLGGSSAAPGEEGRGGDGRGPTVADCTPTEPGALEDGYYVVQPGEPGLSSVADQTCVPMRRLQRLNENLDPQLIPQGACVNLRRDGCRALAEG